MQLFVKKDRFLLVCTIFVGGITAALAAFVSIMLQKIIDVAIQKDIGKLGDLFVFMLIYLAVFGLICFLEAYLGKLLLRNVSMHLRDDIFRGVIKRKPMKYNSRNSADYLSALINDVKLVEENFLIPLMLCFQMVVVFLSTLGILLYLSPIVTGVLSIFLVLMFVIPSLLGTQLQKRQDAYSERLARFTAKAKDYLNGYEVIRGYSMYPFILNKYKDINRDTAKKKFSADTLLAVNECISDIISHLSVIVIVFISAYLLLKGEISMGTLLALIQLSGMFVGPVVMLMQNIPKVTSMKPVLAHLAEFAEEGRQTEAHLEKLHAKKGRKNKGNSEEDIHRSTPHFKNALICQNVTFGYSQDSKVLNNLNLCIEAGHKYALLGDSGCGKSTLIKLLTGYSRNFEGTISYDQHPVKDIEQTELNCLVSVIHQNVFLFDTDIHGNICLGEKFTQEELESALERSGVNQFLPGLTEGLSHHVGENGHLLSGGQRQRIAVARALIRHTPILIIDEGTSAVDQQTAFDIENSLLAQDDLTIITITHHLNDTLRSRYNNVLRLENGNVSCF